MAKTQNPHFQSQMVMQEKIQRQIISAGISDDTIRHLQDENRKFLNRKIDSQRERILDNEEKLYTRHAALGRVQADFIEY